MKISMKLIKAKERLNNVRKPMYAIGDSIIGLEDASRSLPKADNKIKILVSKLNTAHKELITHLNANYLWD